MTRTATRVAAAVGATVVMLGLATPALACTTTDAGGRSAAVSANQAKNDPGMVFHKAKDATPLTLAELQAKLDAKIGDKLTWLGAVQARVSASDRFSAEQKTAVLAHLQTSVDALTQLRADVAAATSVEGVRAVLMAADVKLFHHGFRTTAGMTATATTTARSAATATSATVAVTTTASTVAATTAATWMDSSTSSPRVQLAALPVHFKVDHAVVGDA
jgi:hypothetical protein